MGLFATAFGLCILGSDFVGSEGFVALAAGFEGPLVCVIVVVEGAAIAKYAIAAIIEMMVKMSASHIAIVWRVRPALYTPETP